MSSMDVNFRSSFLSKLPFSMGLTPLLTTYRLYVFICIMPILNKAFNEKLPTELWMRFKRKLPIQNPLLHPDVAPCCNSPVHAVLA